MTPNVNENSDEMKKLNNLLSELAKISLGTGMPIVNSPNSKFGGCNNRECPHINAIILCINGINQLIQENKEIKQDLNMYLTNEVKKKYSKLLKK